MWGLHYFDGKIAFVSERRRLGVRAMDCDSGDCFCLTKGFSSGSNSQERLEWTGRNKYLERLVI